MADEEQIKLLKEGVEIWNNWRRAYRREYYDQELEIKLDGADLQDANLNGVDFGGVDLTGANLVNAKLEEAELFDANLTGVNFTEANLTGATLTGATLTGANLTDANLFDATIRQSDLTSAILKGVQLEYADLAGTKLQGVDLSGVDITDGDLSRTDLSGANLKNANLNGVNLYLENLTGANLSGARLVGADLTKAKLIKADFTGANLQYTTFVQSNIDHAILTGSKIFGLSAWAIKGIPKKQSSLIITLDQEKTITVDDLQVAQFIYLLLNNKNVRNVIHTITSKAVLILGSFIPERKKVLDMIREELHKYDYVPILFDFGNTENQSLLETVMTLAGMAHFTIADVTAATMVREELRSIVEKYPTKPIQPILAYGEKEYVALPEMRSGFKNILQTFSYKDVDDAIAGLSESVIKPAENWLKARKAQLLNGDKTEREIKLEIEIEVLKKQLEQRSL